jgi:hypothetical protein
MQVWAETGAAGLGLLLGFLLGLLIFIGKMDRGLQPFALGAYGAAVTIALFGFNFWTDALWGAFA